LECGAPHRFGFRSAGNSRLPPRAPNLSKAAKIAALHTGRDRRFANVYGEVVKKIMA